MNCSEFQIIKPKDDSEISYFMNQSHLFIFTSRIEGFGLPPLEAMACGCAVLLTNCGGVNEYASSNENCLMYEPKNLKDMQEKFIKLINNKKLINKLSKKGKQTAKLFQWQKSASELLKIINKLN